MKFLTFKNDGLLDVMGLLLMGASTKRGNKEKIGEYGTGWKYALATLFRNRIPVHIYIDGVEVKIETYPVILQNDKANTEFSAFKIDGKEAYFTTEMGPDWKVWMGIREIYCNCLDQKHSVVSTDDGTGLAPYGKTLVAIGITEEVESIIDHWMEYFCFERTDDVFEIPGKLKIYKKYYSGPSIIYRKGIKVAESKKPGCFDYDFHHVPINEIREADFSDVTVILKEHLLSDANAEVINAILASKGTWEKDLNFYTWDRIINKGAWQTGIGKTYVIPEDYTANYSTATKEVIEEDKSATILMVPTVLARLISDEVPDAHVFGFVNKNAPLAFPQVISEELNLKIADVLQSFESDGIIESGEYVVSVCEFSDGYTKAIHNGNVISISHTFEKKELMDIAIVLLKEILLIRSKLSRSTTEFEDYLVGEIIYNLLNT